MTTVQRYTELTESSSFVVVMFYRGHWCPFCIAYLESVKGAVADRIAAAGGTILVVTSEPSEHLDATIKSSGYAGEIVSDPTNALAGALRESGDIDVAVTKRAGYADGMAQPALLVKQSDGTVLFKWAIVPSMMNLGGASDRPDLEQVMDNVEATLGGKDNVHSKFKSRGVMSVMVGHMMK
ncbi:hypothetical protein RQP46_011185 [Phenoliferia psychrophenolica]